MSYKYFINAIEIAKKIIKERVTSGDIVVDCTVGKGNDTLLLAQLVGPLGKVYGFDIQESALEITKKKLIEKNLLERVVLVHDGHENLYKYIDANIRLAVFNLGYLPKGDHSIVTKPDSTIEGIKNCLKLLKHNGIVLITSYIGHPGGLEEKERVEIFLKSLNQKEYNVLKFKFINEINNPPILYGVEKSKE